MGWSHVSGRFLNQNIVRWQINYSNIKKLKAQRRVAKSAFGESA